MIEARIIADSISPAGCRITTFVLKYPRFIHSELMTHRAFSRNAASSRAIPIQRMIEAIRENPARPVHWGTAKPGMQAGEPLPPEKAEQAVAIWDEACHDAIAHAERLLELGVHKQVVNRLLEPFAHMTTLVTATEWENFFALRAHPDAQPEFQVLAYRMLAAYLANEPVQVPVGGWHIPFGDRMPDGLTEEERLKIATARCARVSYLTFDGEFAPEKDFALHDRLAQAGHWSPFEHCARALPEAVPSGNLVGWRQYRKEFPDENRRADLKGILATKPDWITL